jgi:CRISPR-associated protein Cas1
MHDHSTAPPSRIAATFGDSDIGRPALVMDGSGASLTVHHGQLVLRDGIGEHRRERRISRVDRTVRRIVVLSRSGYVTLEAIRWCAASGITVMQVERDGAVIAHAGAPTTEDARIRRGQVLAGTSDTATEITRTLLACKLHGQADIAERTFLDRDAARVIRSAAQSLATICTIDGLRSVEGGAAGFYWQSWIGSAPNWAPGDLLRIPPHWCMFTARPSMRSEHKRNRGATDPINAALNYSYALAEAECVALLREYGIDPTLGVLHADKEGRYSLALDLLETIRPEVDRSIIQVLGVDHRHDQPHISTRWFKEARDGTVRLIPPLTHRLADHLAAWSAVARPLAAHMANVFSAIATHSPVTAYVGTGSTAGSAASDTIECPGTASEILSAVTDDLWVVVATAMRERLIRTSRRGGPPADNDREVFTALLCQMNGHRIPPTLNVTRSAASRRLQSWKREGIWQEMKRITEGYLITD